MNREEILKRLVEIQNELNRLFTDPNYRDPKLEPMLKEEYNKLLLEYSSMPLDMGPMTIKAYIVFELPNGDIIKSDTRSFYLDGKPYYIEYDNNNQPCKITSTTFDEQIRQLVPCFYNVQIQLVQIPRKEPTKEVAKISEPISKVQEGVAMMGDNVDWLMKQWICNVCGARMFNSVSICRNCGRGKREDAGKPKPKEESKGPERKYNQAFGFRSFLKRKEK
jgi:ribosomal protein L40E